MQDMALFYTLAHRPISGKSDRMFIFFTKDVHLDKKVPIEFLKSRGSGFGLHFQTGCAFAKICALQVLLFGYSVNNCVLTRSTGADPVFLQSVDCGEF